MKLSCETVLKALEGYRHRWSRPADICDYLDQCGPLAFVDYGEYKLYHYEVKHKRYAAVYRAIKELHKAGKLDRVLGDDKGNEVRVYKVFAQGSSS